MKTEPNNSSLHKKSFKILLQYSVLNKQNKKQKQNLTNKQITPTKPHKETMLFAKPIKHFLPFFHDNYKICCIKQYLSSQHNFHLLSGKISCGETKRAVLPLARLMFLSCPGTYITCSTNQQQQQQNRTKSQELKLQRCCPLKLKTRILLNSCCFFVFCFYHLVVQFAHHNLVFLCTTKKI